MMKTSNRFLFALSVVASIAVASGVAHGWLDGRWESKPNVEAIGAQLNELPKQMGDWSLVEDQELEESAQSQLRCYGYALKVYQNVKNARRVNVAVLFGPRGPIAVHTPEICYSGQGVTPSGSRTKEEVNFEEDKHSIWRVNLGSKKDMKPELEAYYAWSDGGQWQAAEYPRVWFTGRLYKLQLACQPTKAGEVPDAVQFLKQFLPKLQPLLVKSS